MKYPIFFLIVATLCTPIALLSQEVIIINDMKETISSSSVGYEFDQFDYEYSFVDLPLVQTGLFLNPMGDQLLLSEYADVETFEVRKLKLAAEEAIRNKKFTRARKFFLKMLNIMPNHSQVMMYIGHTFEKDKDLESSEEWYQKAIDVNPINHMAHRALGEILLSKGEFDLALESMLTALVLNRNDSQLVEAVNRIARFQGKQYSDWTFAPQYQLLRGEGGSIKVEYNGSPWKYYGLSKAFWTFEPGYKEVRLDGVFDEFDVLEEQDCMERALYSYENLMGDSDLKKSAFPAIHEYNVAKHKGYAMEYILYEVAMQESPYLACTLTKLEVKQIVDYLKNNTLVDTEVNYKKI